MSKKNQIADQERGGGVANRNGVDEDGNDMASPQTYNEKNLSLQHLATHMKAGSLLLAFLLFAIISWVALFTILSNHTEVARDKIYPFFESTYFEGKAGARVFTYLGAFYMIAGAISLAFLARGIRLPKPKTYMVRSFRMLGSYWTMLEMSAVVLFFAVQLAAFLTRVIKRYNLYYDWPADKLWYEVCKTLGKAAAVTLMLLFLPVSKSCFWWDVFNYKFERAVKLHRFLAWFLVFVIIFHAATAVASLALADQFKNCMWPSDNCIIPGTTFESNDKSRIITYGWISALIAVPLVITSLPWFRRHHFEWFFYSHFLFVPSMVMVHLHFEDMIYFTAPGLAAYVLDKVLFYYISRRPTKIVSLTKPAPGFVRMVVAVDQAAYEPGQWMQLKVPAVSLRQWHPMSVSSSSAVGGKASTITFDIKVLGNWTRDLESLAARFDAAKPAHTCIFLDGFHGSSHAQMQGYLNHDAVIMFAGGIGVTPMISALRTLVQENNLAVRRAVLVWVVRRESVVDLYRRELARIQSLKTSASGCQLQVLIHATLSQKEDEINETESSEAEEIHSSGERNVSDGSSQRQGTFKQYLGGYSHKLVLTIGAGGGYLLGIFLSNYITLDEDWRFEYKSLLQLCLALLFAGTLVVIGLLLPQGKSLSFPKQTTHGDEGEVLADEISYPEDSSSISLEECREEPNVVVGCRPNIDEILNDTSSWCIENGCASVGVAVCGPDKLVQSVVVACKDASSANLQFVVDDETFDW